MFEEAVSVAASLVCATLMPESLLDLLFVGPRRTASRPGRARSHRAAARGPRLRPQLSPASFRTLQRLVLEHQALVSGCICVLVAWDDDRRNLVRALRALGVPTKVLLITPPGATEPIRTGWTPPTSTGWRSAGSPRAWRACEHAVWAVGAAVLSGAGRRGFSAGSPIAAMLELARRAPWRWDFTRKESTGSPISRRSCSWALSSTSRSPAEPTGRSSASSSGCR